MTKKLSNKKGFTLAELLVVVAIIAVLVAVSIPIFSAQTKKANVATNQANARAAKAAAVTSYLGGETKLTYTYDIATGTITTDTPSVTGTATTDPSTWTTDGNDKTAMEKEVYTKWVITLNADATDATKVKDGSVKSYGYVSKTTK